ncbi:PIN domain-like protein, partial [Aureobasidium melanogenum]
LTQFPCIGKHVEAEVAAAVAVGDLHPHTKQPLCPPKISRNTFQSSTRSRAQALQTPDLKKHKSIDSFFKPQRTPLAELDPNSFTPSPSQQRLLQRSPASWSAEPLRRPSLLSRAASTAHASQLAQRSSPGLPRNKSNSPKRQRLCSDGSYVSPLSTPLERVESGTSKFFKTDKVRKSPVLERSNSISKDEFNLWSDNSIEQAMSLLPGPAEQRSSVGSMKKLSVFQDVGSLDVPGETSDTTSETPFTAGLANEIESLRSRFSYQQPASGDAPTDLATTSESKRKRHETDGVIPCSSPVMDRKSNETLQGESPYDDINEADWLSAESQTLSRVSGQNTQSSGSSKPCFSQGSEDLLIPDSEGEEDDEEEQGLQRRPSFPLDLARFAFTG